jgi:hypothetical protein
VSKVDLRLQCGMPCSKLEVSTVQHGTLSGAGYLHQSHLAYAEAEAVSDALQARRAAFAAGRELRLALPVLGPPRCLVPAFAGAG